MASHFCPVRVGDWIMPVDLLALHKLGEFDVVLGMDWLTKYYATIDCKDQTVTFREPGQAEVVYEDARVRLLFSSIQALLSAPNLDDPLSDNIAKYWKANEAEAIETGGNNSNDSSPNNYFSNASHELGGNEIICGLNRLYIITCLLPVEAV
uniref:Reverse transcriptase domain-containing protein n=1 Tax=Ananas comosus var. bracteatus TaxID=296719 RepID=A0A6V7PHJ9_ANACO|nr:unnamed protein product [Ananas comosus var. bracteatus]